MAEEKTKSLKEVEKKTEKPVKTAEFPKTKTEKLEEEKEYVIPLRAKWKKVPRYKRASKAIKTIKEFLVRHMRIRDRDLTKIKIDKYLNEAIWLRGIKKPPKKIKVKVKKDGDLVKVEIYDMPDKLKFKKARLEKREEKAQDFLDHKKAAAKKLEDKVKEQVPATEETTKEAEEKKKEEDEKKAAVVEAGEEQTKKAAKQAKHQTKTSKQPKRQQRKALAK